MTPNVHDYFPYRRATLQMVDRLGHGVQPYERLWVDGYFQSTRFEQGKQPVEVSAKMLRVLRQKKPTNAR